MSQIKLVMSINDKKAWRYSGLQPMVNNYSKLLETAGRYATRKNFFNSHLFGGSTRNDLTKKHSGKMAKPSFLVKLENLR